MLISNICDCPDFEESDTAEAGRSCPATSFPGDTQRLGCGLDLRGSMRINDIFIAACDGPEVYAKREFTGTNNERELSQHLAVSLVARQWLRDEPFLVVVLDR